MALPVTGSADPVRAVTALGDRSVAVGGNAWLVVTGDHNTIHAGPQPVGLPHLVGAVPRQASSFQHRAAELALSEKATDDEAPAFCQILIGGGGVGKTQIAARRARQVWAQEQIDLLLWVSAGSRDAIVSAYAQAGSDVTGADQSDPERAASAFLAWLHNPERRWLVVLDDLTDPADVQGIWPPEQPGGQVLVTTRRHDAALKGNGRRCIDVGLFTADEAAAYLTSALQPYDRQDRPEDIRALACDLGHLPLALSQAAAYLIDAALPIDRPDGIARGGDGRLPYRKLLADRARSLADVVPEVGSLPDDQTRTLNAAWSLSIERADRFRPVGLARPMLQLVAMLDSNGIPISVLTSAPALTYLADPGGLRRWLRGLGWKGGTAVAEDAAGALRALHRLSLIDHTTANPHQAVRVHQLIQRSVREALSARQLDRAVRTAAEALLDVWPETESDAQFTRALRASVAGLDTKAGPIVWRLRKHPVLFRASDSLGESGLVASAVTNYDRLRATAHEHLGPDHPHTLVARNNLARWRGEGGDLAGALTGFSELLTDRVRVLGPDHPHTLSTRHNVATLAGMTGDASGAAIVSAELLADELRVLGPDHPHTLTTRGNLAEFQAQAGDVAGALTAYSELLADRLRVLGPDHRDTLRTRENHATWLGMGGDVAGAVTAFAELVADRNRILGPDHPDALGARNNLARWRGETGDADGAVAATAELLADQLRVLGPDHPHTLTTRNNLASWRGKAGDAGGAVAATAELLADQIHVLGPDHPHTLRTRHNLATWLGEAGDIPKALTATAEVLTDRVRVLGPDHPDTLRTRQNLADWLGRSGDPDGAAAAYAELLTDRLRILSPDHPDILINRADLAHWQEQSDKD
ncbi:tetratricopeptide repeat protein (plasmid) [Streptomyces sp. NBC_00015]|uniref:tetratricopeptide repeat protein n=1 Tax=Streptomyces sp. NBC_00015 TaxID=2903611 RepID=UPI0032517CE9